MYKYKVCVYAISKNEGKFVERWMKSMSEADIVVVTDTGSTDDTVEKLKANGAVVYEEVIDPWRFDTARNLSLSHVPEDVDIAICTDMDEVFNPGWREKLEECWVPDATMGNYIFNWLMNSDGSPNSMMVGFKVHKRDSYTWHCPIHEYPRYIGKTPEKKIFIEGMVLNHFPDKTKTRGSYLPLLEMAVKEDPESDRMRYYLGREYMYSGRYEDCIRTLKEHLNMKTAFWKEERSASMRWIAKSYFNLGNKEESYNWYMLAIAELPTMRDAYVEFAQTAYHYEDWETVFYMTHRALLIKEKSMQYINSGYSWDFTPDDLAAIACYRLGLYQRSYEHAKIALEFDPDNERLKNNLVLIEKML